MATARVLFVPGFMQRGEAWKGVAERLPERYPSTLLDHEEHTFEGRLAEIAAAGEGAAVVGYSLGGRLALRAALRDPDRYSAVVTVGTTAGLDVPGARAARQASDERLAGWLEVTPIEEVVRVWERQSPFGDQPEALVEEQRAGRLSHDPRDLALLLRTAGQGALEPVWEELGLLSLPVLAIAGARDENYVRQTERMAKELPHGAAAIVENAGHAPQLQRPDEVARLLADFLDENLG